MLWATLSVGCHLIMPFTSSDAGASLPLDSRGETVREDSGGRDSGDADTADVNLPVDTTPGESVDLSPPDASIPDSKQHDIPQPDLLPPDGWSAPDLGPQLEAGGGDSGKCPTGKNMCGTQCVDLQTSLTSCGKCFKACSGACCAAQCYGRPYPC